MKRVKIMLVAALVVAGVGGALAFKAAKFEKSFFCSEVSTTCPTQFDDLTTTTQGYIETLWCSTEPSTTCTIRVKSNK